MGPQIARHKSGCSALFPSAGCDGSLESREARGVRAYVQKAFEELAFTITWSAECGDGTADVTPVSHRQSIHYPGITYHCPALDQPCDCLLGRVIALPL